MTNVEKLQKYIIKYLEKQINRIKNITKPSQISHIIEDIDEEIVEEYDKYFRSITKSKYFKKDSDLNDWFQNNQ